MSRAFVKDADDKVDDLPDRPISTSSQLRGGGGLAAIDAAIARFEAAHAASHATGSKRQATKLDLDLHPL